MSSTLSIISARNTRSAGLTGANVTRACVVEQLNKLNNFSTGGLTGPISLDNPKGQAVLPIKLFQTEPATASVKALTDFVAY